MIRPLLALLTALGGIPDLHAQEIRGRVVDAENGDGVGEALIEVFDEDGEKVGVAVAGSGGHFEVDLARPGGPFVMDVWAMSYRRGVVDSLHVTRSGALDVGEIRLEASPVPLDTMRVRTTRRVTGRELVRRRQLQGQGTFVSGAVVKADEPYSLTQYLADAAGIMVRQGSKGPYLSSPRAPNGCMAVQVNHWPGLAGYRTLDDIPPGAIAAVEIYNTPREIPQEKMIGLDAAFRGCGLVNIWLWNSW